MGDFSDHALKKVIRENWCKPLLNEVVSKLGCKLLYFGLPAQNALDIVCWNEFIDRVIAFQCRNYPDPSDPQQPRDKVIELEKTLLELERQQKLKTFSVYDGYIEEVVIKRRDTSGQLFTQSEIVTLYNLDFCNQIATPLTYFDDNGQKQECYKSDAIKRILEIQSKLCSSHNKGRFVMFLSLHSDFLITEEERFLSQSFNTEMSKYLRSIQKLRRPFKTIKHLKAYVHSLVSNAFSSFAFSSEFLPAIYYKGVSPKERENWLITFTVLGSYDKNPAGVPTAIQDPLDFWKQSFLQVESGKICTLQIPEANEIAPSNSSVTSFRNSRMLSNLW